MAQTNMQRWNRARIKTLWQQSPLRMPAFRRLWLGLFISYIGDQFSYIALPWFVLQLTGSGQAVSSVLFASTMPRIVTGPIWGRLLDKVDPRKVMGWNAVARGLTVLALPLLHWSGHLTLEAILILSFIGSISAPSTDIGVRVTVPRLVGSGKDLEAANGLLAVALQASVLIGPGLAGIGASLIGMVLFSLRRFQPA